MTDLLKMYMTPLLKQSIEQSDLVNSLLGDRTLALSEQQNYLVELLVHNLQHTGRLLRELTQELIEARK